jgi:hypothetical protein
VFVRLRRLAGAVPPCRRQRHQGHPAGSCGGAAQGRRPRGRWQPGSQERSAPVSPGPSPDLTAPLQWPDLLAALPRWRRGCIRLRQGQGGRLPAHRRAAASMAGPERRTRSWLRSRAHGLTGRDVGDRRFPACWPRLPSMAVGKHVGSARCQRTDHPVLRASDGLDRRDYSSTERRLRVRLRPTGGLRLVAAGSCLAVRVAASALGGSQT